MACCARPELIASERHTLPKLNDIRLEMTGNRSWSTRMRFITAALACSFAMSTAATDLVSASELSDFADVSNQVEARKLFEQIRSTSKYPDQLIGKILSQGFTCGRTKNPNDDGDYAYVCIFLYCVDGNNTSISLEIGTRDDRLRRNLDDSVGHVTYTDTLYSCDSTTEIRENQRRVIRDNNLIEVE